MSSAREVKHETSPRRSARDHDTVDWLVGTPPGQRELAGLAPAREVLRVSLEMRTLAVAISILLAGSFVDAADVPAVDVHASCAHDIALDAATRTAHVSAMRTVLVDGLHASSRGMRFGVDASIAKLEVRPARDYVEVRAEVHVVVSDDHARVQWVGTSSAVMREHTRRLDHVRAMQREAVENATRELVTPVRSHLLAAVAQQPNA